MRHKRIRNIAAVAAVLLALSLSLCACGPVLELKKGKFVCSKTGVEYQMVRSVYLPKSVATDVYATMKINDVKVDYFAIEGLAPEEWLVSETGDMLYAGDPADLPSLGGFDAVEMYICYNYDMLFTLVDEKDFAQVSAITSLYENEVPTSPAYYDYNTYKVLFLSDAFPHIYYELKLIVTEDAMYLEDISTGGHVEVTELFSGYSDLAFTPGEYQ